MSSHVRSVLDQKRKKFLATPPMTNIGDLDWLWLMPVVGELWVIRDYG